jgi:hypothetical protein
MNPLATVGEESVIFPVAPFHSAAPVMAGRGLSGGGCRDDHRAGGRQAPPWPVAASVCEQRGD